MSGARVRGRTSPEAVMEPIILHHYDLSPFAEKVRRVLAYKGLPWRAVAQPLVAPKPDLTPLTGGYRRIPVLQIGADVYCDTALIVRRLEALAPEPAVLPPALAGLAAVVEDWADHRLFMQAVPPALVELLPGLPADFLEDRAAMSPGFTRDAVLASAPHARAQLEQSLDRLAAALDARPFLLGEAFTVADAACFHPLWFLRLAPGVGAEVERRPALATWFARVAALGQDRREPMTAAAALALAGECTPADIAGPSVEGGPCVPGERVSVVADDYGRETVEGEVVRVRAADFTLVREDTTLGEVAVHFPRAGYRVTRLAGRA